jgi:hypothetical protein
MRLSCHTPTSAVLIACHTNSKPVLVMQLPSLLEVLSGSFSCSSDLNARFFESLHQPKHPRRACANNADSRLDTSPVTGNIDCSI